MSLRVLFLGEGWFGCDSRACAAVLRRLGHDVIDIDYNTVFPVWRRFGSKALKRLIWPWLVREYNELVLSRAKSFRPDILLAFKGTFVQVQTLRALRERGAALYNYYPDTSAFAHGPLLAKSLPEYDCVFFTKKFGAADVRARVKLRNSVFLPHGYDPELHHPMPLDERDRLEFGHDVVLIAVHMPHKEEVLHELLRLRPQLDLGVWGNNWMRRCRSPLVRARICGGELVGPAYVKGLRAAKICLGIMSGVVRGASQSDETTTRTYNIPATRSFMLHERTPELAEIFEEGREVAAFGSARELAEKIDYYLAHPGERERIAQAAYERCVPAYSYENRMKALLEWHFRRMGQARGVLSQAAGSEK